MRRTGKLITAVLALLFLTIVLGGTWKLVGKNTKPIEVTAQFDSAAGLYEGNAVAVLGIPVGTVTKVTPKGGYVEVEFTVDKNVRIPADAQAVTVSTSILTERHIELSPPYRDGPVLGNHSTIGLTRTKTPVEFDRVLGVLDELSLSLRGDGSGNGPIADLVNAGAEIADGNGNKIKTALDELSKALRLSADGGGQTREQLTTIVTNTSSLLDAAARNDTALRQFSSTIRQLSQVLADEDFGSGTTGKKLSEVITQAGSLLEANRDTIKQAILNGNVSLQSVDDSKRELSELFDVLPLMLDNIYNIVDRNNGAVRAHFLTDKAVFDSQFTKEVCNILGLRQLGCSTGTLQDYGPDFGLTYVLDGLSAVGQ